MRLPAIIWIRPIFCVSDLRCLRLLAPAVLAGESILWTKCAARILSTIYSLARLSRSLEGGCGSGAQPRVHNILSRSGQSRSRRGCVDQARSPGSTIYSLARLSRALEGGCGSGVQPRVYNILSRSAQSRTRRGMWIRRAAQGLQYISHSLCDKAMSGDKLFKKHSEIFMRNLLNPRCGGGARKPGAGIRHQILIYKKGESA